MWATTRVLWHSTVHEEPKGMSDENLRDNVVKRLVHGGVNGQGYN